MELEPWIYAALVMTGLLAGFIDAVAGGGGLIMMPALLSAGLPPHLALGTNKLQSSMGVAMATWTFHGKGLVDIRANWSLVLWVLIASAAGSAAVQVLDTHVLQIVVPVLLMLCAAYVVLSPRMDDHDRHERLSRPVYAPVAGSIGFYDGFFGPGTGSFFVTSLVGLRGMGLIRATALAKLFNLTSNVAALAMFIVGGKIIWSLGIAVGLGNMTGSWLGSHTAMRYGARLIRPVLVVISLVLTVRLLWSYWS